MGVPQNYEFINLYNSNVEPSTVHCADTGLAWFFKRYLLQKLISVFEFKNIPENWDIDYFTYTLFITGFISVIETDRFGVIPQRCSLRGYDVFYRPTNCIISNHLIKQILEPKIGVNCSLIKMQPDYCGAWDLISYYADMMALCSETAAVNMVNSKLAYVFGASDKSMGESFKKMFDRIASGQPAVFIDKNLYNEDGRPAWETFNQDLRATYIAGDILEDLAKWDSRFNTDIGIPNVNIAKQSGVSDQEINANNIDTNSKCHLWLETIRKGLKQTNELFGTNIEVNLRFENNAMMKGVENNGNVVNFRAV